MSREGSFEVFGVPSSVEYSCINSETGRMESECSVSLRLRIRDTLKDLPRNLKSKFSSKPPLRVRRRAASSTGKRMPHLLSAAWRISSVTGRDDSPADSAKKVLYISAACYIEAPHGKSARAARTRSLVILVPPG